MKFANNKEIVMKYWWAVIIGAILGLNGCYWQRTTNEKMSYQIQGINAYRGQTLSDLYDINGAPNAVKNLDSGAVMWVYYTNYRPVGGGELISYNQPTNGQIGTSCMVKVIIQNDIVQQVMSNCR